MKTKTIKNLFLFLAVFGTIMFMSTTKASEYHERYSKPQTSFEEHFKGKVCELAALGYQGGLAEDLMFYIESKEAYSKLPWPKKACNAWEVKFPNYDKLLVTESCNKDFVTVHFVSGNTQKCCRVNK